MSVSCYEMYEDDFFSPDQEEIFKDDFACLFMCVKKSMPVWWCPWHMVDTWNTLLEVDYQGGEEPSLTVVKTVMDMEQEEKITREWYQITLCKNIQTLSMYF